MTNFDAEQQLMKEYRRAQREYQEYRSPVMHGALMLKGQCSAYLHAAHIVSGKQIHELLVEYNLV